MFRLQQFIFALIAISVGNIIAFGAVNIAECEGCHGKNFNAHALGQSKIVKDMPNTEVVKALIGYKNGTYGGSMKSIMQRQMSKYSIDEIKNISIGKKETKNIYDIAMKYYKDKKWKKASELFEKILQDKQFSIQDKARVQDKLGVLYLMGWGVKINHSKARKLFKQSCDGKFKQGCKDYNDLNKANQIIKKNKKTRQEIATMVSDLYSNDNYAEKKAYKKNIAGFENYFNKNLVYIYNNIETKNIDAKEAAQSVKKDLCNTDASKNILKQGYNVTFIYPRGKQALVIKLDSCKKNTMAYGKIKKYKEGVAEFTIGSSSIQIFANSNMEKVNTEKALQHMKKTLCRNNDIKKLMEQGADFTWIFPKGKKALVMRMDNCR